MSDEGVFTDCDVIAEIKFDKFKSIVDAIVTMTKGVKFEFHNKKGMRVLVRSDSYNCNAEIYVEKFAFDRFEMDYLSEIINVIIDTSILKKELLNHCKNSDMVKIGINQESGSLYIGIGHLVRRFGIKGYYTRGRSPDSKLEYSTFFEYTREDFRRILKAMDGVDTSFTVTAMQNLLAFTSEWGGNSVDIVHTGEDETLSVYEHGEDAVSEFMVDAVSIGLDVARPKTLIRFGVGTGLPLRMVWQPFEDSVIRVHVKALAVKE